MTDWQGSFDESGTPIVSIEVIIGQKNYNFQAIIDTGFSGFLIVPLTELKELPTFLDDIKWMTLADGRRIVRLQSYASIHIADETFDGIATVKSEGNEVILGMKFFTTSRRSIHIFPYAEKVLLQKESTEEI